MRMGLRIERRFTPYKTIRANNKFELIYLIRKAEKDGWKRGKMESDPTSVKPLVCYMTKG